jgi:CubicO group peptidase (beta-lactamase class C family)
MNTEHIPGVAACVVKDGQVIWTGTYGWAHIEDSIEVADTTVFLLASISKTVTAMALMQLWERGLFGLDDDINDYLPFEVHNPYYPDSVITFRMLLIHTSHIRDNLDVLDLLYTWFADSPIPLDTFLVNYLTPGGDYYYSSNFSDSVPGTECHNYCNVAVALIGYLVETMTGTPFDQYCEDSIFRPLDMNETSWFLAGLDTSNIAMPYFWYGPPWYTYGAWGHYNWPIYPAACLRSSVLQLARYLTAFMQYGEIGGVRILDSTTVELMTTVQFSDFYQGVLFDQGLMWYSEYWGERWIWLHTGGWLGVRNVISYYPEENSGVVFLSNGESYYARRAIPVKLYEYAANLVSVFDHEWQDSGEDGHADPGDTIDLTVSILNSWRDFSTVEVSLSSNDPFITLIDTSSSYGEIQTDSIRDNSHDPFILWVDDLAPLHRCTLNVDIMADSLNFSHSILIMIGIPPVLVMDDDGGNTYETYFTESLDRMGVLYDLKESEEGITSSFMSDYEALIWLTGDNSSPIDSTDALMLSDYLNSGGNLFITGQDVEGCADTSFYQDYLHASLREDSIRPFFVVGVDGDPIGHELTFLITGPQGADNQVTPSIISPIGGADSIFGYQLGGCCGVKYEDTYKVVYLSFGFEAINPPSKGDSLMLRIISWYVGVEEEIVQQDPSANLHYLRTQPNPFKGELQVEYFVASASVLELQIYDAAGRMVRELLKEPTKPGIYRIKWDGRDSEGSRVPSGVYFCRMKAGDFTSTKKMILLR